MSKILSFTCWVFVLILWGCAASIYIDPSGSSLSKYVSIIGLGFPFCAAAVGFLLLLCLLTKQKQAFIPLFGLAACYGSLRDYCPVNLSSPPPKNCLKVLSYNTMSFGQYQRDDNGDLLTLRYACSQGADIICLQEAIVYTEEVHEEVLDMMKRYSYHYEYESFGGVTMGTASRYPIARKERLFESEGNGATAFYLTPASNDTIIVINAHLESMHLSQEERSQYHKMVRNPENADTIQGKRAIISKIATAGRDRALQANELAAFLDRNKGKKIILMGDFNDTPISYAHHQVCSRLTDAYRATGNGIGRSFNKDAIYVRIDNIFCSSHWKPFAAKVDASVPFSDHYPITAYLQPQHTGTAEVKP